MFLIPLGCKMTNLDQESKHQGAVSYFRPSWGAKTRHAFISTAETAPDRRAACPAGPREVIRPTCSENNK